MTLSAIGRARRWVPEILNRPLGNGMAGGTVFAELPAVPVLVAMTTVAVQLLDEWCVRSCGTDVCMCEHIVMEQSLFAVLRCSGKHTNTDSRQRLMVHAYSQSCSALMLTVTLGAIADVCMEGGGLTPEQLSLIGMTSKTLHRVGTIDRCMTRVAIVDHERVLRGQRARCDKLVPEAGLVYFWDC